MSIRVVIVEDPLDPRSWEDNTVEDAREFLLERFSSWPQTARIYDLEGFEKLDRAASAVMTSLLGSRDVTPRDEAGVERLGQLRGPLLVAVAPADPLTAIIAVVAVAVGVAASLLFLPKVPDLNNTYQSPNNTLSDRVNTARPNARIPDIFGTVRSTPDLISVPYKMFDNNLEMEVAYMCVGRGAYDVSDVRDGDTLISAIAGSGATFYGPGTSPNQGAPQLQIGTAIGQPVLSVVRMNEVNGQVLRPSNYDFLKGDNNIRFAYPDLIQGTGGVDFTQYFSTDDLITIGGAGFEGQTGTAQVTKDARFTSTGTIEFASYNPTALFPVGSTITVTNAGYAAVDDAGATSYVDLSGSYSVTAISQVTKTPFYDFASPALPPGATLTRASSGTRYNSSGALVSEAANAPRFDYGASGTLLGLLVEPASTNLLWPSQDLTSAQYGKNAATATATRLTESASGSGRAYASQVTAVTAGKTYTLSAEAAEVSGSPKRYVMLLLHPAGFGEIKTAVFDLVAKTIVTAGSGVTAQITDLPGGRKLCSLTATATLTANATNQIGFRDTLVATVNNYTLAGAAMDITNMQLEEGTRATSRIITTSAATTRAADVLKLDAAYKGYADGPLSTDYVFDDNSRQTVATTVASGTFTVPTTLNRARLRGVAENGQSFVLTLSNPAAANGDWNRIKDFPGDRTGFRSVHFSAAAGTPSLNLAGTYTVLSVTSGSITLSNPALVNAAWNNLDDLPGGVTPYGSPSLSTSGERWVGPFVVDLSGLDRVLSNFVALGGLYSINSKGKQKAVSVSVVVELTPVDSTDTPAGPSQTFPLTLTGSKDNKDSVGVTLTAQGASGRTRVRVRRTSPTDPDFEGTLVDEVKWRDAYGMAPVDLNHFGDVTTVHCRTYATAGATSVKDRKFNLLARRRLPSRVSGPDFTEELTGTDRVDDIMSAIALDPYIGNYAPELVDFDNIYDTAAQIETYFGSERAVEFGYTFDDANISFEETLATVANCCFSRAYRQGSLIRISFERAQDGGVLLFNHRNVLPRSQQRSRSFGVQDDHDGVELDWTAPKDGATLTYDIPYDRSAVSPRQVQVPGVRSGELAYWHSWRAWNRLKYQNVTLEQEATQEAALVLPTDRVLITNLTGPPGFEGEVLSAEGLDLELSQPTEFAPGVDHVIFLQHVDATVEALGVGPWTPPPGEDPDPHMVTLSAAPRLDLSLSEGLSARPTYEIVPATDTRPRSWLVTEREPNSDFTETVRAVNYSPMYYINDEIVRWLPFTEQSYRDQSPAMQDAVVVGAGALVTDELRNKYVFTTPDAVSYLNLPELISPESYSKATWLRIVGGTNGFLVYSPGEVFAVDGANSLVVGHGAQAVFAPAPQDGLWHHAVATYDVAAQRLELYLDGALQGALDGVPRGTRGALSPYSGFVGGRFDDLRLWKRALTPEEVLSLFRSTRQPFV